MTDDSDDDGVSTSQQRISRRAVLLGGAGLGALAVGGAYAIGPDRIRARLGLGPQPYLPDAPEGQVRLETVHSSARGKDVQLFTAVPAGYGTGEGLPVVVILHGASATVADFRDFGLGRFLTQAVRDGAPPFVLAGADGGVLKWEPRGADDPRAMVLDELPTWLGERGFDDSRLAVWGWSMGGYGALRIAELEPGFARATAAFSPALVSGDAVFADVGALAPERLGLWCGVDDSFYPAVADLAGRLSPAAAIASFGPGGHTRVYWNEHTLEAFAFLAGHMGPSSGR